MRTRTTSVLLLLAYLWPATGIAAMAHLSLAHGHAHHEHPADTPSLTSPDHVADGPDSGSCLVCAQLHQFKKAAGIAPAALEALVSQAPARQLAPVEDRLPRFDGSEPVQARAPPFCSC